MADRHFAPILLLVARLVQGFSTGGEYGGAATFIAEFSTDKRRGFMGSFLEFGTLFGYVLGAGTGGVAEARPRCRTMRCYRGAGACRS